MRHKFVGTSLLAVTGFFLASSLPTTHAQSIGVNFGASDPNTRNLLSTDSAGFVKQTNFNNENGANGTGLALVNSAGAASGVSLTYTAGEQYQVNGTPTTPDGKLLTGFISTNNGMTSAAITLSNITFSSYDVYVYINHDRDQEDIGIALNGGARSVYVENNPDSTANPVVFTLATPFTGPTGRGNQTSGTEGDYIVFPGLTGGTLSIAYDNAGEYGNADRGGIAGLQIVSTSAPVPEPTTWAMMLGGLGMLAGLQRMRSRLA